MTGRDMARAGSYYSADLLSSQYPAPAPVNYYANSIYLSHGRDPGPVLFRNTRRNTRTEQRAVSHFFSLLVPGIHCQKMGY